MLNPVHILYLQYILIHMQNFNSNSEMQSYQNNKILLNGEIFCTASVFIFKFKLVRIKQNLKFIFSVTLTIFQVLDSHLDRGCHIGQQFLGISCELIRNAKSWTPLRHTELDGLRWSPGNCFTTSPVESCAC